MIPPVTDPGLRQLLSGEDVRDSWQSLPIREKRRIIKAVLDVRVTSATKGWNFFDPTRVIINSATNPDAAAGGCRGRDEPGAHAHPRAAQAAQRPAAPPR